MIGLLLLPWKLLSTLRSLSLLQPQQVSQAFSNSIKHTNNSQRARHKAAHKRSRALAWAFQSPNWRSLALRILQVRRSLLCQLPMLTSVSASSIITQATAVIQDNPKPPSVHYRFPQYTFRDDSNVAYMTWLRTRERLHSHHSASG